MERNATKTTNATSVIEYPILKEGVDFEEVGDPDPRAPRGSRLKKYVRDSHTNEFAFFKYLDPKYCASEDCSEKLAYEFAHALSLNAAKIELAEDSNCAPGILSYDFSNPSSGIEHIDAVQFLRTDETQQRSEYYTIQNIKSKLDAYSPLLFAEFVKIIIFDALIGETDRHEENWGILSRDGALEISPIYDTACCLARNLKNEKLLNEYKSKKRDFSAYIKNVKTYFYDEDKHKLNATDLVNYLYRIFPELVKPELQKITTDLTDRLIERVVLKLPVVRITELQKQYIIKYLTGRKKIMKEIIK